MTPDLELSVCIIAYKRKAILLQCIQAVKDTIEPSDCPYEILVCDNCSEDGTPETLQAQHADVRVFVNSENVGFAAANNLLMRVSRGRYLLLLNNDCILTCRAVSSMLEMMRAHPDAAMIGPRIMWPDGTLWPSFRNRFDGPLADYGPRRFSRVKRQARILHTAQDLDLKRHTEKQFAAEQGYASPHEVELLLGACVLVRREFLASCGPMDERYFMYREDSDWCLRARRAGWKLWYCPEAVVHHYHTPSAARAPEFALLLGPAYYESQLIFCQTHFGRVQTLTLGVILGAITWSRIFWIILRLPMQRNTAFTSQTLRAQIRTLRVIWDCVLSKHRRQAELQSTPTLSNMTREKSAES